MTDLEKTVDREVGNDTEHTRVTYLKFVNYGRQLESESRLLEGQYSKADFIKYMDEVLAVLAASGVLSGAVEKVDEDEAFEQIKASSTPEDIELIAQFESLLTNVDKSHTEIMKSQSEQLKVLRAKYA